MTFSVPRIFTRQLSDDEIYCAIAEHLHRRGHKPVGPLTMTIEGPKQIKCCIEVEDCDIAPDVIYSPNRTKDPK